MDLCPPPSRAPHPTNCHLTSAICLVIHHPSQRPSALQGSSFLRLNPDRPGFPHIDISCARAGTRVVCTSVRRPVCLWSLAPSLPTPVLTGYPPVAQFPAVHLHRCPYGVHCLSTRASCIPGVLYSSCTSPQWYFVLSALRTCLARRALPQHPAPSTQHPVGTPSTHLESLFLAQGKSPALKCCLSCLNLTCRPVVPC